MDGKLAEDFFAELRIDCAHTIDNKKIIDCLAFVIRAGRVRARGEIIIKCRNCPNYPGRIWNIKEFAATVLRVKKLSDRGLGVPSELYARIRWRQRHTDDEVRRLNRLYCNKYRSTPKGRAKYNEVLREAMRRRREKLKMRKNNESTNI